MKRLSSFLVEAKSDTNFQQRPKNELDPNKAKTRQQKDRGNFMKRFMRPGDVGLQDRFRQMNRERSQNEKGQTYKSRNTADRMAAAAPERPGLASAADDIIKGITGKKPKMDTTKDVKVDYGKTDQYLDTGRKAMKTMGQQFASAGPGLSADGQKLTGSMGKDTSAGREARKQRADILRQVRKLGPDEVDKELAANKKDKQARRSNRRELVRRGREQQNIDRIKKDNENIAPEPQMSDETKAARERYAEVKKMASGDIKNPRVRAAKVKLAQYSKGHPSLKDDIKLMNDFTKQKRAWKEKGGGEKQEVPEKSRDNPLMKYATDKERGREQWDIPGRETSVNKGPQPKRSGEDIQKSMASGYKKEFDSKRPMGAVAAVDRMMHDLIHRGDRSVRGKIITPDEKKQVKDSGFLRHAYQPSGVGVPQSGTMTPDQARDIVKQTLNTNKPQDFESDVGRKGDNNQLNPAGADGFDDKTYNRRPTARQLRTLDADARAEAEKNPRRGEYQLNSPEETKYYQQMRDALDNQDNEAFNKIQKQVEIPDETLDAFINSFGTRTDAKDIKDKLADKLTKRGLGGNRNVAFGGDLGDEGIEYSLSNKDGRYYDANAPEGMYNMYGMELKNKKLYDKAMENRFREVARTYLKSGGRDAYSPHEGLRSFKDMDLEHIRSLHNPTDKEGRDLPNGYDHPSNWAFVSRDMNQGRTNRALTRYTSDAAKGGLFQDDKSIPSAVQRRKNIDDILKNNPDAFKGLDVEQMKATKGDFMKYTKGLMNKMGYSEYMKMRDNMMKDNPDVANMLPDVARKPFDNKGRAPLLGDPDQKGGMYAPKAYEIDRKTAERDRLIFQRMLSADKTMAKRYKEVPLTDKEKAQAKAENEADKDDGDGQMATSKKRETLGSADDVKKRTPTKRQEFMQDVLRDYHAKQGKSRTKVKGMKDPDTEKQPTQQTGDDF